MPPQPLTFLPTDILTSVLALLPLKERLRAARTCQTMFVAASTEHLWSDTPIEAEVEFLSASRNPDGTWGTKSRVRARPWLHCSTRKAAKISRISCPPGPAADRIAVDSLTHADRLDRVLDLPSLDLSSTDYKSIRRGQCQWRDATGSVPFRKALSTDEMNRGLLTRFSPISLTFITRDLADDSGFEYCVFYFTRLFSRRIIAFTIDAGARSRDVWPYVNHDNEPVSGPVPETCMLRIMNCMRQVPTLRSLSLRMVKLSEPLTRSLVEAIGCHYGTLTQLNLSACSFDPAYRWSGCQLLGDTLARSRSLTTFVGQNSPDMHEAVLYAMEYGATIDRVDIAGVYLEPPFLARLALVASKLRVLRVCDHPSDNSVLLGMHGNYMEWAKFYHTLRDALLEPQSRLEVVLVSHGGIEHPPRRLVRRLAHTLQLAYARHGKTWETMTPGDPDYPTLWCGSLLENETIDGGLYDLDHEEELYGNEQSEEDADAHDPFEGEENEPEMFDQVESDDDDEDAEDAEGENDEQMAD